MDQRNLQLPADRHSHDEMIFPCGFPNLGVVAGYFLRCDRDQTESRIFPAIRTALFLESIEKSLK